MSSELYGKLEDYNTRFFIGSIEDGNGIEVTALIEGTILQKAKFRCFGCSSLRTTTYSFVDDLIGKDLDKIVMEYAGSGHFGCMCPKSAILGKLLGKEVDCIEEKQVYLFNNIVRYDVENAVLLYNIFTVDEVKKRFNIEQINSEENMRLLKILKRVIEDYKATIGYMEGI